MYNNLKRAIVTVLQLPTFITSQHVFGSIHCTSYALVPPYLLLNVRRVPAVIDNENHQQIGANDAQRQRQDEQRLYGVQGSDGRDQRVLGVARVTAAGVANGWCQQRARL